MVSSRGTGEMMHKAVASAIFGAAACFFSRKSVAWDKVTFRRASDSGSLVYSGCPKSSFSR